MRRAPAAQDGSAAPALGSAASAELVQVVRMPAVVRITPYLLLGLVLWFLVLRSGVHATVAGVMLAFTTPLRASPARPDDMTGSPLHRLQHGLHNWVTFAIIPIFGFANAEVSFAGLTVEKLTDHLTLGIAIGLLVGKFVGVFGTAFLTIKLGFPDVPMGAGKRQLLCGIGFTMSLFIGMLAFSNDALLPGRGQDRLPGWRPGRPARVGGPAGRSEAPLTDTSRRPS